MPTEVQHYINGKFVPETEVLIPYRDRSFNRGDGCFDMTRTFDGRIFRLAEHVDRQRGREPRDPEGVVRLGQHDDAPQRLDAALRPEAHETAAPFDPVAGGHDRHRRVDGAFEDVEAHARGSTAGPVRQNIGNGFFTGGSRAGSPVDRTGGGPPAPFPTPHLRVRRSG